MTVYIPEHELNHIVDEIRVDWRCDHLDRCDVLQRQRCRSASNSQRVHGMNSTASRPKQILLGANITATSLMKHSPVIQPTVDLLAPRNRRWVPSQIFTRAQPQNATEHTVSFDVGETSRYSRSGVVHRAEEKQCVSHVFVHPRGGGSTPSPTACSLASYLSF